ncbi:hypothetical protein [Stutzerimonas stutzeri]|uniref:hypothetical protein n=1 Tax=Stutzerimonas stutzeri TaxID=316 RepID=UPI000F77E00B|nr:hypothetical protein [Stutzerimonas stutzeri]MCP3430572.1 hypothetical protein [Stutzerimonas stutzeri]RTM16745.1 hypothetical protein EKN22_18365 [Stutzerimonas stutzeri]
MISRVFTIVALLIISTVALSEDLKSHGDWIVHHATGLSAKNRGALAATITNDITFGFECRADTSQAWIFINFEGNINEYKEKIYTISIGDKATRPLIGYPIQKNSNYVSIRLTSIGNDSIDESFRLLQSSKKPVDVILESHNSNNKNEQPQVFYYTISSKGSTKALTEVQHACRQTSFTGMHVSN